MPRQLPVIPSHFPSSPVVPRHFPSDGKPFTQFAISRLYPFIPQQSPPDRKQEATGNDGVRCWGDLIIEYRLVDFYFKQGDDGSVTSSPSQWQRGATPVGNECARVFRRVSQRREQGTQRHDRSRAIGSVRLRHVFACSRYWLWWEEGDPTWNVRTRDVDIQMVSYETRLPLPLHI